MFSGCVQISTERERGFVVQTLELTHSYVGYHMLLLERLEHRRKHDLSATLDQYTLE